MDNNELIVSSGQCSEAGAKEANEDACGIRVAEGGLLVSKGVAVVIADGVSASEAGKEASHACVQGFLTDYFSTPDTWSVKKSGQKVLGALNHWLHGQGTQLYGTARGMVTTLSVLVIKSTTAHLFHIGDTRIYRLRGKDLECLTQDHRIQIAGNKNYLGRAMGIGLRLEIDYRKVGVEKNDVFILTTDGVHDFISADELSTIASASCDDLSRACKRIVAKALQHKSRDNVTCVMARVNQLPGVDKSKVYEHLTELPFPPPLEPGMVIDGFKVIRELHASKRTEVFLVVDEENGKQAVLKAPSVNYEDDPTYIEMFLHEEWVGKRLDNQHILKICEQARPRKFLYILTEYIEGQTLRQWMRDHPHPTLTEMRDIIEQIAAGLRAFHRMEMIHQDLKPENIIIDEMGTVKIVDFGSTKIAGIEETTTPIERLSLLGTESYTAPEYLQGYKGSNRSDIFSMGIIAYEMLTGKLPYGAGMAKRNPKHLKYIPAINRNREIPAWVDGALRKSVMVDPNQRYDLLSEFIYDLSHPNTKLVGEKPPLLDRNPVGFWRGAAFLLGLLNLLLAYLLLS